MAEHKKHTVETERLFLQQLSTEEHLADYHVLWSSPEAVQWSSSHPKTTIEESKKWMFEETKAIDPKVENFAILLKDPYNAEGGLRMIGKVGIFQFPAEISWMLHPDFWGKGYASEAVKGYLEWYWNDEASSDVHSIMADIDPDNLASRRIAEKNGFEMEKVLKDAYTTASKGLRDLIVYRLLRPKPYAAETKRLYLQEMSIEKHLLEIHAWHSIPGSLKFSSAKPPTCLEDTMAWMRPRLKTSDVRNESFLILMKPDIPGDKPELIGRIGVARFPAEVGYRITPKHQGKGYISEALPAFLEYFWSLGSAKNIGEVLAKIDPTNEPSKKSAAKAGFQYKETSTVQMHDELRKFEVWVIKRPKWRAESERLVFEEIDVEKHLQGAMEMWKEEKHFEFLGMAKPCKTLEDAKKMLVKRSNAVDQPHIRNLAIFLKPSDPSDEPKMIGLVGIPRWPAGLWTHLQAGKTMDTFHVKGELDAPEMGYGLNVNYWGKGYASEAVGAFLKYFWSLTDNHHQQIKRVVAWIDKPNVASRRVLEKNGFKKERDLSLIEDWSPVPVDLTIFEVHRP